MKSLTCVLIAVCLLMVVTDVTLAATAAPSGGSNTGGSGTGGSGAGNSGAGTGTGGNSVSVISGSLPVMLAGILLSILKLY